MPTSRVPLDIRNFIRECIQSVSHLEVLLMLVDNSHREWNAEEVSKELRSNKSSASQQLHDLSQKGLLKNDSEKFRYSPLTEDLHVKVKTLSELYIQMPVTIVTAIFERPQDKLKDLSDAFKIKKD